MSKILRKTAQIFGSSAGLDQIAQFGSLANASPNFTTDPAVIQSLAEWVEGWFSAVIGANSPAIEDMNAFCYVMAYQIAYLMQEGVAEWDAGTTYFTNSLAQSGGILYLSLQDNNLNNPVTNGAFWGSFQQIGLVTPLIPAGGIGTVLTGTTMMYPNLTLPTGTASVVQTNANVIGFNYIALQGTATLELQGTANVTIKN